MRIVDEELWQIMEEYHFFHDLNNSLKYSDIKEDKKYLKTLYKEKKRLNLLSKVDEIERNRKLSKERIERENAEFLKAQVQFINSPNCRKNIKENARKQVFPKKIIETSSRGGKRYSSTLDSRQIIQRELRLDKYSGITAYGDSGRKPREQDWNDEIARNFQKELRKIRSDRDRNGLNNIDRGALK